MIVLWRFEDVVDKVDWVDEVQEKGTSHNAAPMVFKKISHCEGKWVALSEVPVNCCAADEQID